MSVEQWEPGQVEEVSEGTIHLPGKSLEDWARDAIAARQIADGIALTSFCPQSYRDSARKISQETEQPVGVIVSNQLTAAMLTGQTLGLDPMQSFQALDIIMGRPALNALAMRALVQSHGHDVWTQEEKPDSVTVAGRRAGWPESRKETVTWDRRRAQRAGLLDKDNWVNYEPDMLLARATAAVCRRIASDVLLGIPYSAEELADMDAEQQASQPQTRRRASKKAEKAVSESPALPGGGAQPEAEQAGDGRQELPPADSAEKPDDMKPPAPLPNPGSGCDICGAFPGQEHEHNQAVHTKAQQEAVEEQRTAQRKTPQKQAESSEPEPQKTITKLKERLSQVREDLTDEQWGRVLAKAEAEKIPSDSVTGVASVLAYAESLLLEADETQAPEPGPASEATEEPESAVEGEVEGEGPTVSEDAPAASEPVVLGQADDDDPWANL